MLQVFSTHFVFFFWWQGVYGLLGVTAGLLVVVGMVLKESPSRSLGRKHVSVLLPFGPTRFFKLVM
jgi:hypothetical protein